MITLGLNEMKIIHSHDLKMIAIFAGIGPASSKFPCPYCLWMATYTMGQNAPSKPAKPAELRTFDSIRDNYNAWIEDGRVKKRAMDFYNCIELPLIPFERGELVIEKLPPCELHIFSGIFNHIYDAMIANVDLCSHVEKWSNDVGVTRRFCPGNAFVGNDCEKLLKKVDLLLESRPPRSVHKV